MVKESDLLRDLKKKLQRLEARVAYESDGSDSDGVDIKPGTTFNGGWNKCPWVKRGGSICGKKCRKERCSAHIKCGPKKE